MWNLKQKPKLKQKQNPTDGEYVSECARTKCSLWCFGNCRWFESFIRHFDRGCMATHENCTPPCNKINQSYYKLFKVFGVSFKCLILFGAVGYYRFCRNGCNQFRWSFDFYGRFCEYYHHVMMRISLGMCSHFPLSRISSCAIYWQRPFISSHPIRYVCFSKWIVMRLH